MSNTFPFQNLKVYHASVTFVKDIYTILKKFPSEEKFALNDQMRRAVVSIPSNIAEGMGRFSEKERVHFLEISYGSLMEIICQLEVALKLEYITDEERDVLLNQAKEIAKMLSGLRTAILNKDDCRK